MKAKSRQYLSDFRFPALSIAAGLLAAILIFSCATSAPGQQTRLVVMIVVDQMRADYLDRFAVNFTGGFKRFIQDGRRFTHAYHDHAATETAVGHAVLATGELPAHNGIIGNYWFDHVSKQRIYACEDSTCEIAGFPEAHGMSPKQLLAPAIGDIAKSLDDKSTVVSLAQKDRAAILMGGKNPDAAIWFLASKGKFVTSTYYADTIPAWIDSFNHSGLAESFADSIWTKVLPDSAYSNRDSDDYFPHRLDSVKRPLDEDYYYALSTSPYGDALMLALAGQAISYYHLGADNDCDFLLVSCSAADYIGHEFGPDSPEIEDYYIRLDRMLGSFFANLDSLVGRDHYLAVLSSDHGVMPTPEKLIEKGIKASRLDRKMVNSAIDSSFTAIGDRLGLESGFCRLTGGQLFLDEDNITAASLTADSVEHVMANELKQLAFIEDVYTATELAQDNTSDRPYFNLYKNCFRVDQSPHLYLRFPEYTLISSDTSGTGHGSPYIYDNHVPIVFLGGRIKPGVCDDSVRTVDVAPSILKYLNDGVETHFDGHDILRSYD